ACVLTVFSETPSWVAICRSRRPAAISASTSRSRAVKLATWALSRRCARGRTPTSPRPTGVPGRRPWRRRVAALASLPGVRLLAARPIGNRVGEPAPDQAVCVRHRQHLPLRSLSLWQRGDDEQYPRPVDADPLELDLLSQA